MTRKGWLSGIAATAIGMTVAINSYLQHEQDSHEPVKLNPQAELALRLSKQNSQDFAALTSTDTKPNGVFQNK